LLDEMKNEKHRPGAAASVSPGTSAFFSGHAPAGALLPSARRGTAPEPRETLSARGGGYQRPGPFEIVAPEAASSAVPAPAGPEEPLIGAARIREERLEQLKAWARRETLLHDLDELADVLEGRTA
jgi:hypothetical protein